MATREPRKFNSKFFEPKKRPTYSTTVYYMETKKLSESYISKAKKKGFSPDNLVEALIDLKFTPIDLVLELRKIYMMQGISEERALENAKEQYLLLRKKAIQRKQIQSKKLEIKKS